jgi:hypothetical protein
MLTRVLGAAALSLFFSSFHSPASAGAVQRMSCGVVRYYVAKYSAFAAESYARSHGATDAQIEAARRCLKDAPTQTVEAARWSMQ